MACADVMLLNGDVVMVQGDLEAVEKVLSDAARSGQARLAWFDEHSTGQRVGINPAHVAAVRISTASG